MQECAAIYCILLAMLQYWVGVNLVVKFSNVYNFFENHLKIVLFYIRKYMFFFFKMICFPLKLELKKESYKYLKYCCAVQPSRRAT